MIRSGPRTPAHEYACWTRKLDGKGDSNSDSNGASQPPPWTHNSIQPRLDLIARTGRPLRLKSGRSAVHPAPGQRAISGPLTPVNRSLSRSPAGSLPAGQVT
jgi:hypothetical protein